MHDTCDCAARQAAADLADIIAAGLRGDMLADLAYERQQRRPPPNIAIGAYGRLHVPRWRAERDQVRRDDDRLAWLVECDLASLYGIDRATAAQLADEARDVMAAVLRRWGQRARALLLDDERDEPSAPAKPPPRLPASIASAIRGAR